MIQNIDPVFFSIGPLQVRYYGILYMCGFLIAYFFFRYLIKKGISPGKLNAKNIEDYIFYLIIWTVIGARLFEVLFYNFSYFLENPLKIFAVWEGGLSFHGGFLAVILYTVYFCRKNHIPTLLWLDFCAIPASFGLFLGRFANFLNGELYGFPVPNQATPPWWSVLFERTDPLRLYRYPTQIFESLANLLVFIILVIIFIRLLKVKSLPLQKGGILAGVFCIGYGVLRFIVEYWKDYEQDVLLGLSMGQLLCIPVVILGIVLLSMYFRKPAGHTRA